MIAYLPMVLNILFIATTLPAVFLFYKAARNSKTALVIIITRLLLQAAVAFTGFIKIQRALLQGLPCWPYCMVPLVLLAHLVNIRKSAARK